MQLSDLQLNADAFNLLLASLPVKLLGGYIGKISLQASWRALSSGIRIELDRIYLVLGINEATQVTEWQSEQAAKTKQARPTYGCPHACCPYILSSDPCMSQSHLDAWEELQRKAMGRGMPSLVSRAHYF